MRSWILEWRGGISLSFSEPKLVTPIYFLQFYDDEIEFFVDFREQRYQTDISE